MCSSFFLVDFICIYICFVDLILTDIVFYCSMCSCHIRSSFAFFPLNIWLFSIFFFLPFVSVRIICATLTTFQFMLMLFKPHYLFFCIMVSTLYMLDGFAVLPFSSVILNFNFLFSKISSYNKDYTLPGTQMRRRMTMSSFAHMERENSKLRVGHNFLLR